LFDFFSLVDLRLILMPMRKSLKLHETGFAAELLRLRSIGKQSGEAVMSDLKKKWKATVGRICRKGRF